MSKAVDSFLLGLKKVSLSCLDHLWQFSEEKMILFLVVFSLALSGGLGAPTAVYKFVKCNPDGDQANCITHQSETMEWSPDLPTKLPATEAEYLEAEPVADERDPEEDEDVQESPDSYLYEEGSGDEGSAFIADWATPADAGSGELLAENKPNKGGRAFWSLLDEQKPAEEDMKKDHLLIL